MCLISCLFHGSQIIYLLKSISLAIEIWNSWTVCWSLLVLVIEAIQKSIAIITRIALDR